MIKVLVVDDSFFMRKLISDILNSDPEIKVIDTAIFTALKGETESSLLKEVGMYVEKVLNFEWKKLIFIILSIGSSNLKHITKHKILIEMWYVPKSKNATFLIEKFQ